MSSHSCYSLCLPLATLASLVWPAVAQAQGVVAATDGTGTVVTGQNNRFTVEQGSLSADGINQFHSFESFSVDASESVDFVAPAEVKNVLTRVSSVAPSIIDGRIEVSGGQQPNLYLMNPAGVLIGPEASVNLPASLVVTTADGVGIGESDFFRATQPNVYKDLAGSPNGEFVFSNPQSGVVVNEGDLSVSPGAAVVVLGDTVVNTGDISAPGGEITLAAVPGEHRVSLRSPGSLLTLEIDPLSASSTDANSVAFEPLDLPSLLTYSRQSSATRLVTQTDGTVSLKLSSDSSDLAGALEGVAPGSVTVTGKLDASAIASQILDDAPTLAPTVGGDIALVGDRVSLIDADLSTSGQEGGGTIASVETIEVSPRCQQRRQPL